VRALIPLIYRYRNLKRTIGVRTGEKAKIKDNKKANIMGFHNGVPITVVGSLLNLPTTAESSSRRRAEQDARVEANSAPKKSNCRVRKAADAP
jgi:hypothetical protein